MIFVIFFFAFLFFFNDLTIRRWFYHIVGWCFRSLNFLSLYRILLNQKTSFEHIQHGVTV